MTSAARSRVPFVEAAPDIWSIERERLLQKPIRDLHLKIEGTYLVRGLRTPRVRPWSWFSAPRSRIAAHT